MSTLKAVLDSLLVSGKTSARFEKPDKWATLPLQRTCGSNTFSMKYKQIYNSNVAKVAYSNIKILNNV